MNNTAEATNCRIRLLKPTEDEIIQNSILHKISMLYIYIYIKKEKIENKTRNIKQEFVRTDKVFLQIN